jgi:hypothetical protein
MSVRLNMMPKCHLVEINSIMCELIYSYQFALEK